MGTGNPQDVPRGMNNAKTNNKTEKKKMGDITKKVTHLVIHCLYARLNGYASSGALVTPYTDTAALYDSEEVKRQLDRESHIFAKEMPVLGKRYRFNKFTDGSTSVYVWHADEDGDWIFTDDERFIWAEWPTGGEWSLSGWKKRGEFRKYHECVSAAGEADMIAAEEIK